MAEQGASVLRLAVHDSVMSVDDLGPALFNREGDWTSSQHCRALAKDINKVQGFATYRYDCVWAHEPDPQDACAVARHGNAMNKIDTALPKLPEKPLLGVFRRCHLVTLMQMANMG